MLQKLEGLAEKAKITILVDKDNGKMDVVILCAYKDAKRKAEVFNPIFLSEKPTVIDGIFAEAIAELIDKDFLTTIEPITEPKKEKVVSKATKKEKVEEKPIEKAEMKPMPPPPTKNKATGTLTALPLSPEEIDAIENSFAMPDPEVRPRTPQEAFGGPDLFAKEDDWEDDQPDMYMQNDDDLFDDMPEEVDYFEGNTEEEEFYENPTKNFILEQAESKGIPKKMVEEKVIFGTVAKPEAPKPIDDMELQAKDPMEQMKKNNGENYLNRRGKLIIQEVQDPMPESTLKDRWDALLEKAHTHGMKTDGLVFEQQTADTIDAIENWINTRIEAQNK